MGDTSRRDLQDSEGDTVATVGMDEYTIVGNQQDLVDKVQKALHSEENQEVCWTSPKRSTSTPRRSAHWSTWRSGFESTGAVYDWSIRIMTFACC